MNSSSITPGESAFAMMRRLAQRRSTVELCEFCSIALAAGHRHLLEVATRKIICACDPCALRFDGAVGRWKLIPRDAKALPTLQLTDAEWEGFSLPINLAFFFHSTPAGRVMAMYPSPAGATESLLPLASWEALVTANPPLAGLQPDVEALLIHRLGTTRDYYLAPMDVCFELVGLIRLHWRGFSGG
ncbi:MAG TPA: DUF5947 family protein, partial [Bacillota bacterium]|nr:DUF5947 family protein [Bacillota bacterium]